MAWRSRVQRVPRQGLVGLVQAYRLLLKPWVGNVCRFEPSCSAYALQALQQHGALRGGALAGWRILRCHPWCAGGCDPVPDNPDSAVANTADHPAAGLFTRLPPPQAGAAPEPSPSTRKVS